MKSSRIHQKKDVRSCGTVKRISPDTAIHEQNGYAKLLDHKYNILMTNVDNDNSDKNVHQHARGLSTPARCLGCLVILTDTSHSTWLKVS